MIEIFGKPDSTLGRDDHWSLRPKPHMASINVLVNGSAEVTAIWVFDPHSRTDGVSRTAVNTREDFEAIVNTIRQRLNHAAHKDGQSTDRDRQ